MSNDNTTNDWTAREIGALWKKSGQNQKYLSGRLKLPGTDEEVDVVIFTNKYKKQENHPDFRVYLGSNSAKQEGGEANQVAEGQDEVVEEGIL